MMYGRDGLTVQAESVVRIDELEGGQENLIGILTSADAPKMVISPDSFCRPDGILMLDRDHAILIGSAMYSKQVCRKKTVSQFQSTDLSRAYLAQSGRSYEAAEGKREAWCNAGFHLTKSIRVHFSLPVATASDSLSEVTLFLEQNGGSSIPIKEPRSKRGPTYKKWLQRNEFLQNNEKVHDVIVNIDKGNLDLWFGEQGVKNMLEVLKIANSELE